MIADPEKCPACGAEVESARFRDGVRHEVGCGKCQISVVANGAITAWLGWLQLTRTLRERRNKHECV